MTPDILIPCRSFLTGKSRLAGILPPPARARLCRDLFDRTLAAALALPARVAVVTADAEVAARAHARGAIALPDPGGGLNAALTAGAGLLGPGGPLAVLPIDLPDLTPARLAPLLHRPGVTLVPDRREDGTNLMILPPGARTRFAFAYGPGSLGRHQGEARRLGLPVALVRDPALALDIDTEADFLLWSGARPAASGHP